MFDLGARVYDCVLSGRYRCLLSGIGSYRGYVGNRKPLITDIIDLAEFSGFYYVCAFCYLSDGIATSRRGKIGRSPIGRMGGIGCSIIRRMR